MRPGRALLFLFCLCLGAGRGSVDGLVDALVDRVRPALERPGDLDVAVLVTAPAPKLAADAGDLLVQRLRALGVRSAARSDGEVTAIRAAGYERLVRVELELVGSRLRASGTVLAWPSSLWVAGAPAEARAHLFVEVPLDEELRAYLPQTGVAAAPWQARSLPLGDVELLALGVADSELVGLTARELIGWRLEGGRALERWRTPLSGRPAPLRPRADLGTLTVENGVVWAHASPFADGLARAHAVLQPRRGFGFPGLATACELSPGVDWFTAESCGAAAGELPEHFWIAAALHRGAGRVATAAVLPGGTLWLRLSDGAPLEVHGVGAQLAVAALDRAEVVATSEPSEAGEPDALVLRALRAGAPVLHRLEHLPGAVRALAAGDLDGDGRVEIVAAVRDDATRKTELWIVN